MRHSREQIIFILIISVLLILNIRWIAQSKQQRIFIEQSGSSIEIHEENSDGMPIINSEIIQDTIDNFELVESEKLTYIGTYNMSHYCIQIRHDIPNHGTEWCGNSNKGVKGHLLIPDYSIAVPKDLINSLLPVGTKVKIEFSDGSTKDGVVHDTGGALGKKRRIDMCVATHEEAMRKGVIRDIKLYKIS